MLLLFYIQFNIATKLMYKYTYIFLYWKWFVPCLYVLVIIGGCKSDYHTTHLVIDENLIYIKIVSASTFISFLPMSNLIYPLKTKYMG